MRQETAVDTGQCPNCGHVNDVGRATCANCQLPLTAYAGQIPDFDSQQGKLAQQVAQLNVRPPIIQAMALFNLLFALLWPLAYVAYGFLARPHLNAESTNYIGTAVSAVGPILAALVLIPIGLALFALAWATWTQRPWAWTANAAGLAAFALLALLKFATAPIMAFIWVGLACGLAYYWFRPETKSWFGMT